MTKPRRFVVAGDSHATLICPRAEEAVLSFIKDFNPEVRIHLGDAWDLQALRAGATPIEQEASILEDFDAAHGFLSKYFKGGSENYYLEGNHDRVRIEQFAVSRQALVREAAAKALQDMDQILRKCRCVVLPYDSRKGVLRLGKLAIVHGYAHGIGATQKHARVYGNVLHGHTHTIEMASVERDTGPAVGRGIGALCKIDQPYNSRQMNKLRHANGWAYGYLFEDGSAEIFQAREINGAFYAARNIEAY